MGISRGAWIVLAVVTATSSARAGDDLPRYRLEPGMELSYKGSDTFKHQKGSHLSDEETTAWVVGRNGDASVRIVIRQGSRFRQIWDADSAGKSLLAVFRKPEPMEYQVGYFDLSPEGRIGPDSELGFRIDPATLFPRLPDDEAQAKAVWGQRELRMAKEYQYSGLRAEPVGWTFRSDRLGPEKTIYGMILESTFHFDQARGAIARIEATSAQEYGFKGKGIGSFELTGVVKKDATWLAGFSAAADRYFAASRAYERATEAASKDAARSTALLAEAKAGLQSARDSIDQPIFREQLDRQIAKHAAIAEYYADSARRRAEVIGKPAADWSLRGMDGRTHSLADYRGKVVVLDFWYRGCGWCIKAMPQMNALAEQFAGRPVAILGMNTDEAESDARFVIDAMDLKYETLRAKGVPPTYGVQLFPTLILIDPEGKVRDVHSGYTPTLHADLAKSIEGLLPAESKATSRP